MNPPIVIAAFGTTSRARSVYEQADRQLKARFKGHEIHWAFTSRIVRSHMKKRRIDTKPPQAVIEALAGLGHPWAVVQSFHMMCGHEFHRLVHEVQNTHCRVSVGHSLLCSQHDHETVAQALAPVFAKNAQEAVVLVGHGTDHCIWTVYTAFYQRLRQVYGKRAFGGMVEEDYPGRDRLIERIKAAGFRRVRLVPFMLVAGVHFEEDLAGPEDSWKSAFEARELEVVLETEGLGARKAIIDLFGDHIHSALSVIPESVTLTPTPRQYAGGLQ
ncbi:MAG: sirohydrochlorin cobaltochelatase [Desulfobacteraceae bacterium]|jgi:sirohydrochlorin cobaltochelatase